MTISANYATIRAAVPASVGLVAVSKTFPPEAIREAHAAGALDFGENYAQELRDKTAALADLPIRWHFVGRLQANKAKYVSHAFRFHALENAAQADALGARAKSPVVSLLMVNIGREPQKGGLDPAHVLDRAKELSAHAGVRVVGLMCLPPAHDDPEASAPYFAELADLAARGRAEGLALDELSMGMSHDFPVAIRHGATWVRVGSAIFGPRT